MGKLAKIIQPEGIKYMIQDTHYNKESAESYLSMLIQKMEEYISKKRDGYQVAPLMTLEQMEEQLKNMKKFTIKEIGE